jgi:outer membrane protein OmpA-like peptidoglycan-associated protein
VRKLLLSLFAIGALALTIGVSQAYSWRPIVFFEQDRPYASEVFPDPQHATPIINEVAQMYWRGQAPSRVHVVGHADRTEVGDVELSARRALAIKSLLIQRGIPAETIVVAFRGSTQPLVPANGLSPEPQNRRVDIHF